MKKQTLNSLHDRRASTKHEKLLTPHTGFKNSFHIRGLLIMIPFLFIVLGAFTSFSSENGVMERVKHTKKTNGDFEKPDIPISVPKNSVLVKAEYQGGRFFVETRKGKIERFRCTSCHNNKQVKIKNALKMVHGDVKSIHGEANKPLACNTCHNKTDRDFLNTSKNNKIDFDHVYEMCGECHFRQKKDWVGGAHGKRVTYWAGERVVKNCTSCHDPHSPRFKKKWPATYSVPFK